MSMFAGIDYLSYTVTDNPAAATLDYGAARRWLEVQAQQAGATTITRTRQGFTGATWKGGFVGQRYEDTWVSFSGALSHAYTVSRIDSITPLARCRRLDIQLTVPCPAAIDDEDVDKRIRTLAAQSAVASGGRKVTHLDTHGDGSTLYIGSLQSDKRIAIYNKGAETRDERLSGYWRVEMRLRDRYAERAWQALTDGTPPLSILAQELKSYSPVYVSFSDWLDRYRDTPLMKLDARATDREPSVERTITWLERQVAPAIERLLTEHGLSEPDILSSLGMSDYVNNGK